MANTTSIIEDGSLLSRIDRTILIVERFFALISGIAIFLLILLAVRSVGGREFLKDP